MFIIKLGKLFGSLTFFYNPSNQNAEKLSIFHYRNEAYH